MKLVELIAEGISDRIDEMPQPYEGILFLENEYRNAEFLKECIQYQKSQLKSLPNSILIESSFTNNDEFDGVFINYNPSVMVSNFVSAFKHVNYSWITRSAVQQCLVWKQQSFNSSLPYDIIFDTYLSRYDMVISDESQTQNANDYWHRLMNTALTRNLKIGFTNALLQKVYSIKPNANLDNIFDKTYNDSNIQYCIFKP